MRQLVQVANPTTGEMEWAEVATGEVHRQVSAHRGMPSVRVPVGEILFSQEPAIHEKLMNGRMLNWNEIARAADVVLCAVSQDSLRLMFGARSMGEIKRAIETMISAQRLCSALSPRLRASSLAGVAGDAGDAVRKSAQSSMKSLLMLPGQK